MEGQLAEATCSSAMPYGQDVVAEDGIAFLVTREAPSSIAALEQSWDEAAESYKPSRWMLLQRTASRFLLHVEHLHQQQRLGKSHRRRHLGGTWTKQLIFTKASLEAVGSESLSACRSKAKARQPARSPAAFCHTCASSVGMGVSTQCQRHTSDG